MKKKELLLEKYNKLREYTKIAVSFLTIYYAKIIFEWNKFDLRKYLHPQVYSTIGIERGAALFVDLFFIFGLTFIPTIGLGIGIGYFLLKDTIPFLNGQSLGKSFFSILLIRKHSGKPLTRNYWVAAKRNFVLLIPGLNLFDMYFYIKHGERWADVKYRTITVRYTQEENDTTGKET